MIRKNPVLKNTCKEEVPLFAVISIAYGTKQAAVVKEKQAVPGITWGSAV